MMHLDDDELVLYSFGEDTPDAAQREHLENCALCSAELNALKHLVSAGRALDDTDLVEAPDSVWQRIHAELELSPELGPVPRDGGAQPVTVGVAAPLQVPSRRASPTRPEREQRRGRIRPMTALLVAASLVVGLVAGIAGTVLVSRPGDPRLLAEAELQPFPDWDVSGSARVEENEAGVRHIVVDVSAPGEGLTEVWLIDPETSGLVSLGLLGGESGTFAIPEGVDLSRYTVVDVSREPADGNPAHSGDSIARGELRGS
ncbi:anti-sigma factor [Mycetocola zhujimingii]|uniref:Anti-sigma factor n=1 Tax=Mycetocola zhujimingii TaxID=2079792 RepID=A0A2U1TAF1_9MICO|nr:anti-sigma factor [Mycetocola zhujimingii]PWC04669.1 anti-sigma factor [Mycetocola zhujimingii]